MAKHGSALASCAIPWARSSWVVRNEACTSSREITDRFYPPQAVSLRISFEPPGTVVQQRISFKRSGSSDDFNPSIAVTSSPVNPSNARVAVTWSATDADLGINAEVRVGNKDFAGTSVSQALVFRSSVPLVGVAGGVERWGDYSSIAIDPEGTAARNIAWGVNEEIDNPDDPTGFTWGTRFFNVNIATYP